MKKQTVQSMQVSKQTRHSEQKVRFLFFLSSHGEETIIHISMAPPSSEFPQRIEPSYYIQAVNSLEAGSRSCPGLEPPCVIVGVWNPADGPLRALLEKSSASNYLYPTFSVYHL